MTALEARPDEREHLDINDFLWEASYKSFTEGVTTLREHLAFGKPDTSLGGIQVLGAEVAGNATLKYGEGQDASKFFQLGSATQQKLTDIEAVFLDTENGNRNVTPNLCVRIDIPSGDEEGVYGYILSGGGVFELEGQWKEEQTSGSPIGKKVHQIKYTNGPVARAVYEDQERPKTISSVRVQRLSAKDESKVMRRLVELAGSVADQRGTVVQGPQVPAPQPNMMP